MNKLIETYIVDSFTDEPFKGNPAGVCLLKNELSEIQMLSIAKELGLSETAFVIKKPGYYSIRYFSPKMEIPLCGHATLASSRVLFEKETSLSQMQFHTHKGIKLAITKIGSEIGMEFPVYDTELMDVSSSLIEALGLYEYVNTVYNQETNILLIEIEDSNILRALKPDFEALYKSHQSINGVVVTTKSTEDNFDFELRFFWPWSGTNEDPVTGGVHTFLAKYWSDRIGKKKMNSFQCSERSGFMEVELLNDDKMMIKSQAKIILKGELRLA